MWRKELDPQWIEMEKQCGAKVEGERVGGIK